MRDSVSGLLTLVLCRSRFGFRGSWFGSSGGRCVVSRRRGSGPRLPLPPQFGSPSSSAARGRQLHRMRVASQRTDQFPPLMESGPEYMQDRRSARSTGRLIGFRSKGTGDRPRRPEGLRGSTRELRAINAKRFSFAHCRSALTGNTSRLKGNESVEAGNRDCPEYRAVD